MNRLRRMPRTFAYCRVSTLGQTVENQIRDIEAAGFHVEKRRLVTETVSGSSAIEQRPGFMELLDRPERDDVLVVTKLDRLGATPSMFRRRSSGLMRWPSVFTAWRWVVSI
jgi:putative DNA-invertase from lambdoid prophage Rac